MSDKTLLIFESPAKCKKVEGYLGSKYICKASFGHIRDLDKKTLSIDIENNFKPCYIQLEDKKKVIQDLKKIAKKCKEILIATDLDREGEAIGYHLIHILNLDPHKTKRLVFNEITKKAMLKAIQSPRTLDINLFNAQQARRIADRLVGYLTTPLLWKSMDNYSLSAGRCQTPALNLIYDREKEIMDFQSNTYYNFTGTYSGTNIDFDFEAFHPDKIDKKKCLEYLNKSKHKNYKLVDIITKDSTHKPSPPFTTSSLQQTVSSKFGITPKKCMEIAQKLYESGRITYMRTDSTQLSDECKMDSMNYIHETYGEEFHSNNDYTNKTQNAQEAHEAIRPVKMFDKMIDMDEPYNKIYHLIWKRTIASQMSCCKKKAITIKLDINDDTISIPMEAPLETIQFLGHRILYDNPNEINEQNKEIETLIKELESTKIVEYTTLLGSEKITKSKTRYTEASLIKMLEKEGIGRPSTFSAIINNIQDRGYVEKKSKKGIDKDFTIYTLKHQSDKIDESNKKGKIDDEKNKLFITELGKQVLDLLYTHFHDLFHYNFTSTIELKLDLIAEGSLKWNKVISDLYNSFSDTLQKLDISTQKKEKHQTKRKIGKLDGEEVYVYKGKYGPVAQIGTGDNVRFIKIPESTHLNTVTLEIIKDIGKYPKTLGDYQNIPVQLNHGKFGYYITYKNKNYSVPNDIGKDCTIDNIPSILQIKKENNEIKRFKNGIVVRIGKYGPYFCKNKKFVSIPSNIEPDKITLTQCNDLYKKKYKPLKDCI